MVSVGTSAKNDLGANVECHGPREIRAVPSIFPPPAQPREACVNSMAYVLCRVSGAVAGASFSQPWSVRRPWAGLIAATRRVWRLIIGGCNHEPVPAKAASI